MIGSEESPSTSESIEIGNSKQDKHKPRKSELSGEKDNKGNEPVEKVEPLNWETALIALRYISRIASSHPAIVETATGTACDTVLKITARALSYLNRKDMEKYHPENIPISENPRFRPYSEIIKDAIRDYEAAKPGVNKVTWRRNPNYTRVSGYFLAPAEKSSSQGSPQKSPLEIVINCLQEGGNFEEAKWLFLRCYPGNEETEMARRSHEAYGQNLSARYEEEMHNVNFLNIKYQVECIYGLQEGEPKPLSASDVLHLLLEEHSGDLTLALYSFAGFLKFMAREERNYKWLQKYLADEYSSLVSYQFLDSKEYRYSGKAHLAFNKISRRFFKNIQVPTTIHYDGMPLYYDFSLPNQAGKPYHAANMAALLELFPPEAIAAMVAVEFMEYGAQHGANKALADMMVLLELKKIEKVLKKYEVKEENNLS